MFLRCPEGAEEAVPGKVVQTAAEDGIGRGNGAAGKARKGPVVPGCGKARIVHSLRPGGIPGFRCGHQIVPEFLTERKCQGVQAVQAVVLHIEGGSHHDQGIDLALGDHVIQHGLVVSVGLKPVILIVPRTVHKVEDVVVFVRIIAIGQIDQGTLFHAPSVRGIGFRLIDQLLQGPGLGNLPGIELCRNCPQHTFGVAFPGPVPVHITLPDSAGPGQNDQCKDRRDPGKVQRLYLLYQHPCCPCNGPYSPDHALHYKKGSKMRGLPVIQKAVQHQAPRCRGQKQERHPALPCGP